MSLIKNTTDTTIHVTITNFKNNKTDVVQLQPKGRVTLDFGWYVKNSDIPQGLVLDGNYDHSQRAATVAETASE